MNTTEIHKQVQAARQGQLPRVIARMPSGWAVLGPNQFLPGYCLLLPDDNPLDPVGAVVPPHLNALSVPQRQAFLQDMTLLGDAVLEYTGALRINYEMLGNLEPALHAHVFPRYGNEPPALATKAVWLYDWEQVAVPFDPQRHQEAMMGIGATLLGVARRAGVEVEVNLTFAGG